MSVYDYLIRGVPFDERYYLQDGGGVPPIMPGEKRLDEVLILATKNQKVKDEIKDLLSSYQNKNRFNIVDKDSNKSYFYRRGFNNNPVLERVESVITGANKGNTFTAPSSREYLADPSLYEEGKLKPGLFNKVLGLLPGLSQASFSSYLNYLDRNNQKNTPAGRFEIANYYDNKLENPSPIGWYVQNFKNAFVNGDVGIADRAVDYVDIFNKSRINSYGDGRMLTLKDSEGKGQSWAIHSTGNEERLDSIRAGKGASMSGGCVNVDGSNTCAFDFLRKGDIVSVLPQKTNNPTDKTPYVKPQREPSVFSKFWNDRVKTSETYQNLRELNKYFQQLKK